MVIEKIDYNLDTLDRIYDLYLTCSALSNPAQTVQYQWKQEPNIPGIQIKNWLYDGSAFSNTIQQWEGYGHSVNGPLWDENSHNTSTSVISYK